MAFDAVDPVAVPAVVRVPSIRVSTLISNKRPVVAATHGRSLSSVYPGRIDLLRVGIGDKEEYLAMSEQVNTGV